jgi:multidrug resistance efflux pump
MLAAFSGGLFAAENDLPRRRAGETTETGAALFQNDLLPGTNVPDFAFPMPEPVLDVDRAKSDLERAQRKEERWQKLGKTGVLAQVEVESCVLQTARLRVKYEQARVAEQQRALDALRQRAAGGELSKDTVTAAESALQTAQTIAAEAAAALRRTQLLYAETNVERQRRLIVLGVGSKSQLKRAETTLLQLQGSAR